MVETMVNHLELKFDPITKTTRVILNGMQLHCVVSCRVEARIQQPYLAKLEIMIDSVEGL